MTLHLLHDSAPSLLASLATAAQLPGIDPAEAQLPGAGRLRKLTLALDGLPPSSDLYPTADGPGPLPPNLRNLDVRWSGQAPLDAVATLVANVVRPLGRQAPGARPVSLTLWFEGADGSVHVRVSPSGAVTVYREVRTSPLGGIDQPAANPGPDPRDAAGTEAVALLARSDAAGAARALASLTGPAVTVRFVQARLAEADLYVPFRNAVGPVLRSRPWELSVSWTDGAAVPGPESLLVLLDTAQALRMAPLLIAALPESTEGQARLGIEKHMPNDEGLAYTLTVDTDGLVRAGGYDVCDAFRRRYPSLVDGLSWHLED